jgi:hypothetical protein
MSRSRNWPPREVILEAVSEAEADAPPIGTLLAEIAALRMIFLNVRAYAAQKPGELVFFVRPRGFWEMMRQ